MEGGAFRFPGFGAWEHRCQTRHRPRASTRQEGANADGERRNGEKWGPGDSTSAARPAGTKARRTLGPFRCTGRRSASCTCHPSRVLLPVVLAWQQPYLVVPPACSLRGPLSSALWPQPPRTLSPQPAPPGRQFLGLSSPQSLQTSANLSCFGAHLIPCVSAFCFAPVCPLPPCIFFQIGSPNRDSCHSQSTPSRCLLQRLLILCDFLGRQGVQGCEPAPSQSRRPQGPPPPGRCWREDPRSGRGAARWGQASPPAEKGVPNRGQKNMRVQTSGHLVKEVRGVP